MEGLIDGRDIGVDLALTVLGHMRTEATRMGLGLAGCVTDRGGHVVASARMDDAPLGALPIAADKAYTSALWGMPRRSRRWRTGGAVRWLSRRRRRASRAMATGVSRRRSAAA